MRDPRMPGRSSRRGWRLSLAAVLVALSGVALAAQPAAADEPKVPEQVAGYFSADLIPRLADLYGGTKSGYDATTKVGTVHRLLAWTAPFLAGRQTETPTELTNNWVATVTDKSDKPLGVATVWINPGSDLPELADYAPGTALAQALAKAPAGFMLLQDRPRSAWLATDGTSLVALVPGSSGVSGKTTPAAYEKRLEAAAATAQAAKDAGTNPGLVIAGIILGVAVLVLIAFILLPDRRRRAGRFAEPGDAVRADADTGGAARADADTGGAVGADAGVAAIAVAVADAGGLGGRSTVTGTPGAKAVPPKATPTKATPTKATPTKATPTKATPTKATPTKATPTKASATKVAASAPARARAAGGSTPASATTAAAGATASKPPRRPKPAAPAADADTQPGA
jgi:hypothetical protein